MHASASARVLVVLLAAAAAVAQDDSRVLIEGVPGVTPPDCTTDTLTRILNKGYDADLPEHYLAGLTGIAFLATVCQNNCTCRDYREVDVRLLPTLEALGFQAVQLEEPRIGKDAVWARMRASLDRGVPVLAFNLFGRFTDVPLVGYDSAAEVLWGLEPGEGDEPRSVPLARWLGQELRGYVVEGMDDEEVDRRALERERLLQVVAAAHRRPLDGG